MKFTYRLRSASGSIPALVMGVGDIGAGPKISTESLRFYQRYMDDSPLEFEFATGSYDVTGWSPGFGIIVHKSNPLTHITMDQLDGIFGAERNGGWDENDWHPEYARGPEKNIRTWGQLGLKGAWANKPIHPYGLTLRYHQATTISDRVLKGSDKWNENIRMYANFVADSGKLSRGMSADIQADPYSIAYYAAPTRAEGSFFAVGTSSSPDMKNLKILPLAGPDGKFYEYTMDNLFTRKYPLWDAMYFTAVADANRPMTPAMIEFFRFVLSREGQEEIMRDGKYLPLNAGIAREQRNKLEARIISQNTPVQK